MSICGYNRTKKRIKVHNHWLQVLEKVNPWSWQNITQYIKMDECPFQLCITSAAEKSSSIKSKSQQSIKFHAISCQTFKLISFDKANQVLFCLDILLYLSTHPLPLSISIVRFLFSSTMAKSFCATQLKRTMENDISRLNLLAVTYFYCYWLRFNEIQWKKKIRFSLYSSCKKKNRMNLNIHSKDKNST